MCYMHLCRYQSNYWLLPNPDVFGAGTVLASTPTRNYTALDYDAFFADAGCVTHVVLLFCIFMIGNNTSAVLKRTVIGTTAVWIKCRGTDFVRLTGTRRARSRRPPP